MAEIMQWRRLDLPGHEVARLDALNDGWKLAGAAAFEYRENPAHLDYVVICDAVWRTSSAHVKGTVGTRKVDLAIRVDPQRRWYLNEIECAAVEASLDIDLGFSPSTNLLPIRRLALAVGEEAEVKAAWLPFPSLEFELLHQVYRRLEESTYHYESGGGSFARTLKVNAIGFVTSYPGLWQADSVEL